MKSNFSLLSILLMLGLTISQNTFCQIYNSHNSGAWATAGNWWIGATSCNGTVAATSVPTSSTNVEICNGYNMLVGVTSNAGTLTVDGGATLTVTAGTLTVTTNITISGSVMQYGGAINAQNANVTVNGSATLIITAGTLTVSNITINGTLNMNGGTLTVSGSVGGTGAIINNGTAATINAAGSFTIGTFAPSTGLTVVYNGSGAQTIAQLNYYNLTITNSYSTSGASVNTNITVANNLTVGSGSDSYLFITNGTLTVSGTTTVNGYGYIIGGNATPANNVLSCNGPFSTSGRTYYVYCTINCNNSFTNTGIFNHGYNNNNGTYGNAILNLYSSFTNSDAFSASASYSTVNYMQAANGQIVIGLGASYSYYNLGIYGGNKSISANTTVAGTLNMQSGVLTLGSYDLTLSNTTAATQLNIPNPSSSCMIVATGNPGRLIRYVVAASYLYPIGDASGNFTPISFTVSAMSNATNIGFYLQTTAYQSPTISGTPPSTINTNRNWLMTSSYSAESITYIVNLYYVPTDVTPTGSTESVLAPQVYNGSSWTTPAAGYDNPETHDSYLTASASYTFSRGTTYAFTAYNTAYTQYYSAATGNLDNKASWGTNTDGSGTNPSNFTTAYSIFTIQNNPSPTIGTSWTVSGANSRVTIGDGTHSCTFTIPSGLTFTSPTTTVSNNAVLKYQSTGNSFGALTINGTLEHNVDGGSIPSVTWNTGSTLNVTGVVSNNPTGFSGKTLSNLIWNCTNQTTATGAIDGAMTVNGNLTISTGTLYDAGYQITGGSGTFSMSNGVFSLGSASSCTSMPSFSTYCFTGGTVNYNCSNTGQTVSALNYYSLQLNNVSKIFPSSGTVGIAGTFTPGSVVHTVTGSNIIFNGTSPQTIPVFNASNGGYYGLQISNSEGASLAGATSVCGTLYLTNGAITTTGANLLTITNTGAGAVSGGSSSSYINGPLARTLPSNLLSGSTYVFPFKGTNYNELDLVNPTTNSGGNVVIQSQLTNSGTGNAGTGLSAINSPPYWQLIINSGSSDFTNTGVSLWQTGLASINAIGLANSAGGVYNSIGGTVSGGQITTASSLTSANIGGGAYFQIGNNCVQVTSVTVSPSQSPVCSGNTVTFTATVGGSPTNLSYQWTFSGGSLPNATTNSTYVISSAITSNTGTYTCVGAGCNSSSANSSSTLIVNALPAITLGVSPAVYCGTTSANLPYTATTNSPNQYSIAYDATAISAGFSNVSMTTLPASPITLTVPLGAGAATYNGTITVTNTTTGCSSSGTAFAVSEISVYTWNGSQSTDWNDYTNWNPTTVKTPPTIDDDVQISGTALNMPVINSGISGACNTLTIYPNATLTVNGSLYANGNLTINPLASLTVNGSMTVTGSLYIQSASSGTGAFTQIDDAVVNISGNVTVQGYIGNVGYHYITSPFDNSSVSNISNFAFDPYTYSGQLYQPETSFPASAFPNMFEFDEHHTHEVQSDQNAWLVPEANETMTPAKGYAADFNSSGFAICMTEPASNLNGNCTGNAGGSSKDIVYTVSWEKYSTDDNPPYNHDVLPIDEYGNSLGANSKSVYGKGPTNGYHIIGNPYPSPVDPSMVTSFQKFTSDIVYFYSTSQYYGIYGYFGIQPFNYGPLAGGFTPPSYIPSMQAFYIQNYPFGSSGTPSDSISVVTFNNSMRSVVPDALQTDLLKKNGQHPSNLPSIYISVFIADNSDFSDVAAVFFYPQASAAFNPKYDATKLLNTDLQTPNIYSLNSGKNFAIKAFPTSVLSSQFSALSSFVIPLGMRVNTDGKYTIKASEIYNLPSGTQVFLIDLKNNITQDLTSNPSYTFNINGGDDSRFFLKFANQSTVDSQLSSECCFIYSSDKDLFVNYNNPMNEKADLRIYSITGEQIGSRLSLSNGTYHTTLDVASGVYFVKVISPAKVYIRKVYIQ